MRVGKMENKEKTKVFENKLFIFLQSEVWNQFFLDDLYFDETIEILEVRSLSNSLEGHTLRIVVLVVGNPSALTARLNFELQLEAFVSFYVRKESLFEWILLMED